MGERAAGGPDVVLVVLDTLSARAAGLGGERPAMPQLTAIAEGGMWFRHAVANAPWTYPSHASLLTGLLPSEHGMDTPHQFTGWELGDPTGGSLQALLPPGPASDPGLSRRWLPALFRAAGYETVCVSNNPWVSRLTEMDHGFTRIRDPLAVRLPRWRSVLRSRPRLRGALRAAHCSYRAAYRSGDQLAGDALRLVREWAAERDAERPFLLVVNLVEAHAPYLTPLAPAAVRSERAGPRSVFRAMRLLEPHRAIRYNLVGGDGREAASAVQVARTLHERAARYLDTVVGELYSAVNTGARGLAFCVTSDHGESFGEHGALLHGFTLDEEALHVPLVMTGAGLPAAERSESVDLRRVYATLLEAAGVPVPAGAAPSMMTGAPGVAVAERDRLRLPSWTSEAWPRSASRAVRLRAVYRDPWKLVSTETGASLYDLATDPRERVDRAADRPDVSRDLLATLPPWPDRRPGREGPREQPLSEEEEREMADRLAALGYLE